MFNELADERWVFNSGNDFAFAAASHADLDVEVEDAFE